VSDRSGLGEVEIAVLKALDSLGARPDRGHVRSARVLAAVEDLIGLAPGYAYQVLIDLAQPWTVPVTLVNGQGNFGSRGNDPPANFRYTDARLSKAGALALAAERGELASVPVGLVNGNTYREGTRPPFRPAGVIAAIREIIGRANVTDAELVAIVGAPVFPTGHVGRGDLEGLAAGRATELRLEADVTISSDGHQVIVENIPFGSNTDDAIIDIANRARVSRWAERHPGLAQAARLPLSDIRDVTDENHPNGRFICTPAQGTSPEELREMLMGVYGVYTIVRAKLPRQLPAMIRAWAATYAAEDLGASLTALEMAL
jgi:DNA gyrase/topoisomerase IV subunit A